MAQQLKVKMSKHDVMTSLRYLPKKSLIESAAGLGAHLQKPHNILRRAYLYIEICRKTVVEKC